MTTGVFTAPKARSGKGVPPAGAWPGKILKIIEKNGAYEGSWRFRAKGRSWTLTHRLTEEQLGDLLVDLGHAGDDVDLAQIANRSCTCVVATFGGRTSARVIEVRVA